jgi:GNAT superfamily N-acetyltransferase
MAAILSNLSSKNAKIRPIRQQDLEACARAAYSAHHAVAKAHNVPCEYPSPEFSLGMIGNKLRDPNAAGFVAECGGQVVGSIFLNMFPETPVAAIGPLTVDPAAEGSAAGHGLMQAALDEARDRHIEQVRLVQSPSHLRSLALYVKVGFEVREPLVLMSGKPSRKAIADAGVRSATLDDIPACNDLCIKTLGFARGFELRSAITQNNAYVVQRDGHIGGYSTGLGFRGHTVGETTDDLKKLIAAAPAVIGPGFFVPIRNGELLRWLFSDFRASWPATLMTYGRYKEVKGAFMPSIAF